MLKRILSFHKLIILFLTILIVACAAPENQFQEGDGTATIEFVDRLRSTGASVEVGQKGSLDDCFGIGSQILTVNGQTVQVFEYSSIKDVKDIANSISSDGYNIGHGGMICHIDWVDTPYFYKRNLLVVLYVGSDPSILQLLENVVGKPFAGG